MAGWTGGFAQWIEGDTAYLSVAFTWKLDEAYARALFLRAQGYTVRVGGPALFLVQMQHEMADLEGVQIGGDVPDAIARHNPLATKASEGCDRTCWFCIVPKMTGGKFVLIPDFPVRPILCDNNLSGLDPKYQDHIIERYQAAGVAMIDANSGFEPASFTPDVYERWKPLVNAGRGPWRFAYDDMPERADVLRVMRMLESEPARRKRVYTLIGNEPFAECMQRIQEVIDGGCEPYAQPVMKLNALVRKPWVRFDWTAEKLHAVARWVNAPARIWRHTPFADYDQAAADRSRRAPRYDTQQGLFL
jgi:hypothetical protein